MSAISVEHVVSRVDGVASPLSRCRLHSCLTVSCRIDLLKSLPHETIGSPCVADGCADRVPRAPGRHPRRRHPRRHPHASCELLQPCPEPPDDTCPWPA